MITDGARETLEPGVTIEVTVRKRGIRSKLDTFQDLSGSYIHQTKALFFQALKKISF